MKNTDKSECRLSREHRAVLTLEIDEEVIALGLKLQAACRGPLSVVMFQYGLLTLEQLDKVYQALYDLPEEG